MSLLVYIYILADAVDFGLIKFDERYNEDTCRFTEMVRTLVKGTDTYHSFRFAGLDKLIENKNQISNFMLSIDIDPTNLQNMASELSMLADFIASMEQSISNVYLNEDHNFMKSVSTARQNSSTTIATTLDYLKSWGSYETEESTGTGLWSLTAKTFYEGVYKAVNSIARGVFILTDTPMGSKRV